ncbi:MAG: hypothetical protein U1E61_14720 [Bradyrhizobium sp.]|mgnify:CR=1 FL=1
MPFLVQANADDHTLSVTTETAKEAFAKAIEWHVVHRFTNISINDGARSYSIADFSSEMALREIAQTAEAAAELGPRAKGK